MSCLGDPSRFHLVRQLARGERCVSDLARRVGLSQSCTTRHLQALQREQIVLGERAGKRVVFHLRLDEPQIGALIAWVMASRPGMPGGPGMEPSRPGHGADLHSDRPGSYISAAASRPSVGVRSGRARKPAASTRKGARLTATPPTPTAGPRAPQANARAPEEIRPTHESRTPGAGAGPPLGGAGAAPSDPPPVRYRAPRPDLEDYLL